MKPYSFHPEALLEADEAARFYEERQGGLGIRFIESLSDALNRIGKSSILYRRETNPSFLECSDRVTALINIITDDALHINIKTMFQKYSKLLKVIYEYE